MQVNLQYLIILFVKGTEMPNNFIFGSVRYQDAPCWALCNISTQITILEYEHLKY